MLVCAAGNKFAGAVTTKPLALLAILVPVACYVWALRDAPLGLTAARPAVRFAVLGLGSLALSLGGFLVGLMFLAGRSS